jgi:hypothetical protein
MFKIMLVKNELDQTYDLTPIVGSFSWDSYLSVTSTLDMSVLWNDTQFFPSNPCELGDMVLVTKDDEEVYRGILVNQTQNGRQSISYQAKDFAWYLDKSKSVYQFNGVPADKAITRILNDFGMPIGTIATMSTKITKIYIQKSPAAIIDDILQQQEQQSGKKYSPEMSKGSISIVPVQDRVISGTFQLTDNIAPVDVLSNPLEASRSRSIEDLRNRVKVITSDSDSYVTQAVAQDTDSASHYGLLEETVKVEAADAAKSRQVAKILLARLNRVQESNKLKLMGDVQFKAGYLFDVVEPVTGMNGRFMIKSCKHTVASQIHTMELELVLPEDVA